MESYRILSLDGGGTWAIIQAMALKEIYGGSAKGRDVLSNFDLVAATSGGSLTLAGLVKDLSLDELVHFFKQAKNRKQVFARPWFFKRRRMAHALWRWAIGTGPKYDAAFKLLGLKALLGEVADIRMSDLSESVRMPRGRKTDFLICGYDYDWHRARFFRSNQKSRTTSQTRTRAYALTGKRSPKGGSIDLNGTRDPTLAEAIHASTNAPVDYFDAPAEFSKGRFWDGAIAGLNNPVLAAVTEALANGYGRQGCSIQVLSLGTGNVSLPPDMGDDSSEELVRSGLIEPYHRSTVTNDLRFLALAVLDDPPESATFIAHVMLDQPLPDYEFEGSEHVQDGCIVRLSPLVRPIWNPTVETWQAPDALKMDWKALCSLEMDAVRQKDVELIERLGETWIAGKVANQPIRESVKGSPDIWCSIGHTRFEDGKTAWLHQAPIEDSGRAKPQGPPTAQNVAAQ